MKRSRRTRAVLSCQPNLEIQINPSMSFHERDRCRQCFSLTSFVFPFTQILGQLVNLDHYSAAIPLFNKSLLRRTQLLLPFESNEVQLLLWHNSSNWVFSRFEVFSFDCCFFPFHLFDSKLQIGTRLEFASLLANWPQYLQLLL